MCRFESCPDYLKIKKTMKVLDITMKTENGSKSLGFSQILVDYITKTERWNYVFDCLVNGHKIDKTNWNY